MASSKIKTPAALLPLLRRLKKSGRRVVFTNGCFDLLHVGHVRVLSRARALGDLLVVGLNCDGSVRRLKGPRRPLTPERERAELLASLECVDLVVLFGEDTPERLIRLVRPDVLVKGGDWKKEKIVGARFVESYGGKVRALPYVKDRSTSDLIRRIKASF